MKIKFTSLAIASALAMLCSTSFAHEHGKGSEPGHYARWSKDYVSKQFCPGSWMRTYFSVTLHRTNEANLSAVELDALSREILDAKMSFGSDVQFWVAVDAYADARGSEESNFKLADRRASAMVRALIQAGAPRESIHVVSHGERHARYTNSTSGGMALNRATHVKVHTMSRSEANRCARDYPEAVMSSH